MTNNIIDQLRALMAASPQAAATTDPRAAALARIASLTTGGDTSGEYAENQRLPDPLDRTNMPVFNDLRGRGNGDATSPDLPTQTDYDALGGDASYRQFVDDFGFERLNPAAQEPGYVPMPRPRHPDLDYNNPMGPVPQDIPEGVTTRGSDVRRRAGDELSTEDELAQIHDKMGLGEWEGTGKPSPRDLEYVRQNPTDAVLEDFVKVFGEEALPDMQPDESDDFRDTR